MLINAILVKVLIVRYTYASGDAIFWTTLAFLALYVAFCSYLYSVLKQYYLFELRNYEAMSQMQPVMYA